MAFQDIPDAIARVVGGTVDPSNPRRFSGLDAGDGTGVAGINYAYSSYLDVVENTPCAIVLPATFEVRSMSGSDVLTQGNEINVDDFRLIVLASRATPAEAWASFTVFRDLIPAAFRSHLGLYGAAGVVQGYARAGRIGETSWAGADYLSMDFSVRVIRDLAVTYTA